MDGKAYLEDLIKQRIRDATIESDRPQRFSLAHRRCRVWPGGRRRFAGGHVH
jgi:hypothetical protein